MRCAIAARALPYRDRLSLCHAVVVAVARTAPPLICRWRPAGWLVKDVGTSEDPLAVALNVRLFNVQEDSGALVMDTMGLAAIGLLDVQCHFRGIDPGRVAGLLHSIGRYLFEHGDVIEDGHTVSAIGPEDRWRCRHEMALMSPERVVLDILPGEEHRAGRR